MGFRSMEFVVHVRRFGKVKMFTKLFLKFWRLYAFVDYRKI